MRHLLTATHLVSSKYLLSCLFLPLLLFFCVRNYGQTHYYRDPTSKFFDPSRAYEPYYSTVRRQEAESFVDISSTQSFLRRSKNAPFICVGMLTIARPSGDIYFRDAIGSLLAGLSRQERDAVHLVPFIAHTNASEHPVYTEPWLHNVADFVLTYNNSKFMSEEQYLHIQELERQRASTGVPDREKHLFDYTQVLQECERSGAKYVAVFEDDVLALDGWFHRTRKGLVEVERQTKLRGHGGFFYLRLFYTEGQLGWNGEEWVLYLRWAPSIVFVIFLINATIFYFLRRTTFILVHGRTLIFASLLTACSMIIFFFSAGRVSMLPLPAGVHEMTKYGCCAQAIVYPRSKVPILTKWYQEQRIGFVDTLAEKLADERPMETGVRWALTPSVVQHIGGRSSKGDAQWDAQPALINGKTAGEALWNFAFELNDRELLRKEHFSEERELGQL